MTWWNDLWLNESFATYVSFYCMDQIPKMKEQMPSIWVTLGQYKNWAYATDELHTNHPIAKDAPHTDSAQDMINGITYGKGCSFLKQLMHLIGHDSFSQACTLYFSRYKWKNTVLDDFLDCLSESVNPTQLPFDIKEWCKTFLNTKGVNTLQLQKRGGEYSLVQIVGEFSDGLRDQKIDLACISGSNVNVQTYFLKSDQEEINVGKLDKKAAYIVNYGDHAYCKVLLDDHSAEILSKNLSDMPDTLTRAGVWRSVQAMVKACKIKSPLFLEYVYNNLEAED